MKIGFYIKFNKQSLNSKGNVLGEELYTESLCRALEKIPEVKGAELFAPNHLPNSKLDVMIYLNDTKPNPNWSKKQVLYLQNSYKSDPVKLVKKFRDLSYDGYVFFSPKILEIHQALGGEGEFLPFGVDLGLFYPKDLDQGYSYDLAYVGSDIKGRIRTARYLLPAANYNLGLFGNWQPQHCFRIWRNWRSFEYQKVLRKISQGKISLSDEPVLYSNARINLNFSSQECVDWNVITDRIYKVLACRGFLITDRVSAAEDFMSDCMVFTDGGEDLVEKREYYLKNPAARERIAQRGYEYVVRNSSIEIRAKELFKYLEAIISES